MKRELITGGILADEPFWDGLEKRELRICCCSNCKKWIWPAHFRCADCGSYEMGWPLVEPRGTVYAWTRSHIVSERIMERAQDSPYVVINCELPHAGNARVMGILEGSEEGLHVDAPVIGKFQPASAKTSGYATIRWVLDHS
jgi:uncharacterized OB-fold protein